MENRNFSFGLNLESFVILDFRFLSQMKMDQLIPMIVLKKRKISFCFMKSVIRKCE
jgi:hypothetical protein